MSDGNFPFVEKGDPHIADGGDVAIILCNGGFELADGLVIVGAVQGLMPAGVVGRGARQEKRCSYKTAESG
ncbi:MAG: hypothetical protein BWY83_01196 [bacterium ADurb.Bin478]|nr:MAG: hypothetical protein BWY83_01196 [bacterium ADurb.Bin478]